MLLSFVNKTTKQKSLGPKARLFKACGAGALARDKPGLYSAATGSTITYFPICPRSLNTIRPVILANKVSSLPRPTFKPGFTRVPRCRTIIVPPGTSCPPKALKPNRWAFESRPFRDVPCPFLCAMVVPDSFELSALSYFFFFGADFFVTDFFAAAFFFAG